MKKYWTCTYPFCPENIFFFFDKDIRQHKCSAEEKSLAQPYKKSKQLFIFLKFCFGTDSAQESISGWTSLQIQHELHTLSHTTWTQSMDVTAQPTDYIRDPQTGQCWHLFKRAKTNFAYAGIITQFNKTAKISYMMHFTVEAIQKN